MTERAAQLHAEAEQVRAQQQPKPPRRVKWLIIGCCVLAGLLVAASALIYFLFGWHVQQSDAQWCTFYAGVTRNRAAVSAAFYSELTRLAVTFGCR